MVKVRAHLRKTRNGLVPVRRHSREIPESDISGPEKARQGADCYLCGKVFETGDDWYYYYHSDQDDRICAECAGKSTKKEFRIEELLKIDRNRVVERKSFGEMNIHGGREPSGGPIMPSFMGLRGALPDADVVVYEKQLHPAGVFGDLFQYGNRITISSFSTGEVVRELQRKNSRVMMRSASNETIEVGADDEIMYEPWEMDRGSFVFVTMNAPPGLKGKLLKLATENDIVKYKE